MRPRALVVEDDERIMDMVEDTLYSLGHEHDWATNQHDARVRLEAAEYDYVLLDLQIPAKPKRGGADKEFGRNLLGDIQRIKGARRVPVIVMTAYASDCVAMMRELFADGATDFIAKPFPPTGRTLAHLIRQVLGAHRAPAAATNEAHIVAPGAADAAMSATIDVQGVTEVSGRFGGGELALHPDRAELCGVKIIADKGAGLSLQVLRELSHKDDGGRYVRLSAEELATRLGPQCGVGTVTGCVRTIRTNVRRRLARHCGAECQDDDLIRNDEQGYHLRDWITVRLGREFSVAAKCREDAASQSSSGSSPLAAPRR